MVSLDRLLVSASLLLPAACTPVGVAWVGETIVDGQRFQHTSDTLRITRSGELVPPAAGTYLSYGDTIETAGELGAMLAFFESHALLRPATRAVITEVAGPIPKPLALTLEHGGAMLVGSQWHPGQQVFLNSSLAQVTTRHLTASFDRDGRVSVHCDAGGTHLTTFGSEVRVTLREAGGTGEVLLLPAFHRLTADATGTHAVEAATPTELNEIVRWSNDVEPERRRWILPGVVSMRCQAAEQLLAATGVEVEVQLTPAAVDEVDLVLDQRPGVGALIQKVNLSVGAPALDVPDLRGMDGERARATLARSKLVSGTVQEQLRADHDTPQVVSQSPPAGTPTLEGRKVDFVVSVPAKLAPKLTGLGRQEAELLLNQNGFSLGSTATKHFASVGEGLVVAQVPAAGAMVQRGSSFGVVLSAGILPAPALELPSLGGVAQSDDKGIVQFDWADLPEATEYEIRVAHPRDPAAMAGRAKDSTVQGRPTWGRSWIEAYTWRVRGRANDEWGQWSEEWSFRYEPPDVALPAAEIGGDPAELSGSLRQLGLLPESVDEYSDAIPVGRLVRLEPEHDRPKPGDRILLIVSKGLSPETQQRLAREAEAERQRLERDAAERRRIEAEEAARVAAEKARAEAAAAARLAAIQPKFEHERLYATARERLAAGDLANALSMLAQAAAAFDVDAAATGRSGAFRAGSRDLIEATWALVAWRASDLEAARAHAHPGAVLPEELQAILAHIDEEFVPPTEASDVYRGLSPSSLRRAIQRRQEEEARLEREFRARQDNEIASYWGRALAMLPPLQLAPPSKPRYEHRTYGSEVDGKWVRRAEDPHLVRIQWDAVPGAVGYLVLVGTTSDPERWARNQRLFGGAGSPSEEDGGLDAIFDGAGPVTPYEVAGTSVDVDLSDRVWEGNGRQPMAMFRLLVRYESDLKSLPTQWIFVR